MVNATERRADCHEAAHLISRYRCTMRADACLIHAYPLVARVLQVGDLALIARKLDNRGPIIVYSCLHLHLPLYKLVFSFFIIHRDIVHLISILSTEVLTQSIMRNRIALMRREGVHPKYMCIPRPLNIRYSMSPTIYFRDRP